MPSEPFNFRGEAGQTLSGRLDLPDGDVQAHALFAHCFTCSKSSLAAARISTALTRLGWAVLRFDFTGLGRSGGDFADSSFSGSVADILAAARAMRDAARPVALMVGHSLGGAAVLAAASGVPEALAVATVGAPCDVRHVKRLFTNIDELILNGEAEVRIGGRPFMLRRSFVDDLERHDQAARIASLRKPLLILHAPLDEVVGIDNAAAIFQAAKHPKSFVSLDGADHLLTRHEDAAFVAQILAVWAGRYVSNTPSLTPAQVGSGVSDD